MEQVEVRARLIEALEQDLVGPLAVDEVLSQEPSRWYLTGFLVPRGAGDAQRLDPTAAEEVDAGVDGDEDDDQGDDPPSTKRPFLPSSIGCSVLVPPTVGELTAEVVWGDYVRLSEEETRALRDSDRTLRREEPAPESDDEEKDKIRFRYWRRFAKRSARTLPVEDGAWPVPDSEGLMLVVSVRDADAPGLPGGTKALAVFLVNDRTPAESGAEDERSVFQVELRIRCAGAFQPRMREVAADHPDDRRNDLQYRDHREWAVGHGVSVWAQEVDGVASEVGTAWVPRARVYRMKTNDGIGVPLGMEVLAEIDGPGLEAAMDPLATAYAGWIQAQRAAAARLDGERARTAAALLDDAAHALDRIRDGVAFLSATPEAMRAFQLANRAMAMAARRARPEEEPAWRLFQLAFLLLNVRGVAEPEHVDRDVVELLFFPTGGGKTEAYLGIAAFTMLSRRLRLAGERHGGAGVTVLLRYTLRLLTLDQLGRAATLTCALELLRRRDPVALGARRFSVGLWVGRKATPNTLDEAERQVAAYRHKPKSPDLAPPVPLAGCPWCGTRFDATSFDIDKDGKKPVALRIGCVCRECPFSFVDSSDGLPVLFVDEQIYRELPAFLIATVDKFAALPWRGATGALFGRVTSMSARGFYGPHEDAPREAVPLSRPLPPPALVLQDELHLISGPLGTMVGLYETAVGHLARQGGRGPKIIASTATARRATEQVRALYGREKTALFPPQGLDDGDTFFARTDRREEVARLYVGVAAPGRSMKALAVRVYSTLLAAANRWWAGRGAGLDNPADTYMTLVAYFNSLRELGGTQRLVLEEVSPRTQRMSRRHPVGVEKSELLLDRYIGFDVLELTSRQDTASIGDAKAKLAGAFSPKDGRRTDVLLASSMISVGVDIPRLGLMVVNGQPRTVAEYIQASSRVGRSTPGLVVTLHNLFRPRDRSHYERFTAFHECFYRFVEASTVTPFSPRAIERGLAGLTVALARHGRTGLAYPRGAENVRRARDLDAEIACIVAERAAAHREGVPEVLRRDVEKQVRGLIQDWSDIATTMAQAAAPLSYSGWEKVRGATSLLSSPVDEKNEKHELFEHFRAPTSMRDVEPAVHVWVKARAGGGE